MARFMGVALCLVMPSLVATAGPASLGYDASAFLQVDSTMTSIQNASVQQRMAQLQKSVAKLRSLFAVAEKSAREKSSSLVESDEYFVGAIQPQLRAASEFIIDKLAALDRDEPRAKKTRRNINISALELRWPWTGNDDIYKDTQKTGALTVFTSLMDLSLLVWYSLGDKFSMKSETNNNWWQKGCAPLVIIVWWIMGILTMHFDQKLSVVAAIDMLSQMYSSVGYGTTTQKKVGIKLFHGLHAVVSQTSINRVMYAFVGKILGWCERGILRMMAKWRSGRLWPEPLDESMYKEDIRLGAWTASIDLLLWTILFAVTAAADLSGESGNESFTDALYQTMMTMTTVGYGDYSPSSDGGKVMAAFTLPMITGAFDRWKAAIHYDENVRRASNEDTYDNHLSHEVCECLCVKWCPKDTKWCPKGFFSKDDKKKEKEDDKKKEE